MRKFAALLFCSLPCFGAGPVFTTGNFTAHYTNLVTNSFNVTGTGTSLGCIVENMYRATGSSGTPTCGGNAMTKVQTGAFTTAGGGCFDGTIDTWFYAGAGLTAGTIAVSIPTVVFESGASAFIISASAQSSVVDALSAVANGNMSPVAGGQTASMAITTVAANAFVLGQFCATSGLTTSPSSNGTYIGFDGNFGAYFWYFTTNPSAGANTLLAKSNLSNMATYQVNGLSIPPLPSGFVANPTIITVGP